MKCSNVSCFLRLWRSFEIIWCLAVYIFLAPIRESKPSEMPNHGSSKVWWISILQYINLGTRDPQEKFYWNCFDCERTYCVSSKICYQPRQSIQSWCWESENFSNFSKYFNINCMAPCWLTPSLYHNLCVLIPYQAAPKLTNRICFKTRCLRNLHTFVLYF